MTEASKAADESVPSCEPRRTPPACLRTACLRQSRGHARFGWICQRRRTSILGSEPYGHGWCWIDYQLSHAFQNPVPAGRLSMTHRSDQTSKASTTCLTSAASAIVQTRDKIDRARSFGSNREASWRNLSLTS